MEGGAATIKAYLLTRGTALRPCLPAQNHSLKTKSWHPLGWAASHPLHPSLLTPGSVHEPRYACLTCTEATFLCAAALQLLLCRSSPCVPLTCALRVASCAGRPSHHTRLLPPAATSPACARHRWRSRTSAARCRCVDARGVAGPTRVGPVGLRVASHARLARNAELIPMHRPASSPGLAAGVTHSAAW